MRELRRGVSTVIGLCALLACREALAWSIESPIGEGCHERITLEALDRVGYAAEPPPPLEGDDAALFDALPFDTSHLDRNAYAAALVLGARYSDLRQHSVVDLSDLVGVHNAVGLQANHCLREADQDGEVGDREAAADCASLVRELLDEALLLAGEDGTPDREARTQVRVSLLYVGETEASLSALYFLTGWALHVVQDSFAHCYRTGPDQGAIAETMNWADAVAGELVLDLDGPPHSSLLDQCSCASATTEELSELATQASSEILAAMTLPMDGTQRAERLDEILERWMGFRSGCTIDNRFCDSPGWIEVEARSDRCPGEGCRAAGGTGSGGRGALVVPLLAWVAAWLGRRPRRPGQRSA